MSDTKWTPGPWVSGDDPEGDYPNKISIHTEDNFYIAVLDNSSYEEANAHLISAAPVLYEALAKMERFALMKMDDPSRSEEMEIFRQARAALAKARGETK